MHYRTYRRHSYGVLWNLEKKLTTSRSSWMGFWGNPRNHPLLPLPLDAAEEAANGLALLPVEKWQRPSAPGARRREAKRETRSRPRGARNGSARQPGPHYRPLPKPAGGKPKRPVEPHCNSSPIPGFQPWVLESARGFIRSRLRWRRGRSKPFDPLLTPLNLLFLPELLRQGQQLPIHRQQIRIRRKLLHKLFVNLAGGSVRTVE